MMRITFITPFTSLAGGTRVIATYARELASRGHLVTVVSTPDRRKFSWRKQVKFALGLEKRPPKRIKTPLFDFLKERHVWSASNEQILPSEVPDADVVIATWWRTAEWVNAFPASKGRKFYLLQDYEVFNNRFSDRVADTYAYDLKKVAVSSYIRKVVSESHPTNVGDIAVIPNAVDLKQFDVPERGRRTDAFTIGFVLSHEERKNVGLAIDALTRLRERGVEFRAIAFGRGPKQGKTFVPDWVEYQRAPAQNKIAQIYAECDVWLFPTRTEGFGLPLLEAMACRTPVLGTDAGAAPDIINGKNGEILPHDPEAFAEAILRYRDMSASDWKARSDAAYKTALENQWSDATDRLLAVLEKE